MSGQMSRPEARDAVDAWLLGEEDVYNTPQAPNPDTWGLEPEHQAGMMRALSAAGSLGQ